MATRTFNFAGVDHKWSTAGNWDTSPVNGDTAVIPTGQTCIFDIDMSSWAIGLAALTQVGTITWQAGSYLKIAAYALTGNTLATATLQLADVLGKVHFGTATSGTTTTIIDTALSKLQDEYLGGTAWFLSGSVNNVGYTDSISMFGNDTVTLLNTWTTFAAGNRYAIALPEVSRSMLRSAVNEALKSMGDVLQVDVTKTVDVDVDQYTLPSGVFNVRKIEVASSDAVPYGYAPVEFWRELNGVLYFDSNKSPQQDGFTMRIWYFAPHAELTADTDVISNVIDPNWLKWAAVVNAYRYIMDTTGKDSPVIGDLMNEATRQEQKFASINGRKLLQDLPPRPHLAGY